MPEQADPKSDAPQSPQEGHRAGTLWLVILIVLLVVYPLSLGPAAKIHKRYPATRRAIETLYWPIASLARHSDTVSRFYEWYLTKVWSL